MARKIESGNVKNLTSNTYTVRKEDGTKMEEQVVKNNDTGEISRTLDGKKIEEEQPKTSSQITYEKGNGEMMLVILLNDIKRQLIEMNYYMSRLAKDKKE